MGKLSRELLDKQRRWAARSSTAEALRRELGGKLGRELCDLLSRGLIDTLSREPLDKWRRWDVRSSTSGGAEPRAQRQAEPRAVRPAGPRLVDTLPRDHRQADALSHRLVDQRQR